MNCLAGKDSQSKKTNYYNSIAAGYNELHRKEQLEKVEIVRRILLSYNKIIIDENTLLIDIGCGTGISTQILNICRVGIDPSRELILIGNRKRVGLMMNDEEIVPNQLKPHELSYKNQRHSNLTNNNDNINDDNSKVPTDYSDHLGYIQGIAEALPFKDNSCDIVLSITAIHNFDNIKKALKEIHRVAKDKVAITVLKQAKDLDWILAEIKWNFQVISIIENDFDIIFYLKLK